MKNSGLVQQPIKPLEFLAPPPKSTTPTRNQTPIVIQPKPGFKIGG